MIVDTSLSVSDGRGVKGFYAKPRFGQLKNFTCINTLIFVTGRNKRAIEEHLDANNELETMLCARGEDAQAEIVRNIIPEGVACIFMRQS